MEVFEPNLRMLFFVGGRLFKYFGDLHVAVLFGLGGIVGVLVAGLGFPGKCFLEILLRFCSFEFHIGNCFEL